MKTVILIDDSRRPITQEELAVVVAQAQLAQQQQEMDRGGTLPSYRDHHTDWLTDADIARIRELLAAGMSRKVIAAHYGVSYKTITNIHRGLGKYAYP